MFLDYFSNQCLKIIQVHYDYTILNRFTVNKIQWITQLCIYRPTALQQHSCSPRFIIIKDVFVINCY